MMWQQEFLKIDSQNGLIKIQKLWSKDCWVSHPGRQIVMFFVGGQPDLPTQSVSILQHGN